MKRYLETVASVTTDSVPENLVLGLSSPVSRDKGKS